MKAIKQIAVLSKRLKHVQAQHNPLFTEEQRIKQEIKVNQVCAIIEEKMLTRRSWTAEYNVDKDTLVLDGGDKDLYPELDRLLNDGWGRCTIVLEKGVKLTLYDRRVTISFDDKKIAAGFIIRWNIPISDGGLQDSLRKLQEKSMAVRSVMDAVMRPNAPKPEKRK